MKNTERKYSVVIDKGLRGKTLSSELLIFGANLLCLFTTFSLCPHLGFITTFFKPYAFISPSKNKLVLGTLFETVDCRLMSVFFAHLKSKNKYLMLMYAIVRISSGETLGLIYSPQ